MGVERGVGPEGNKQSSPFWLDRATLEWGMLMSFHWFLMEYTQRFSKYNFLLHPFHYYYFFSKICLPPYHPATLLHLLFLTL